MKKKLFTIFLVSIFLLASLSFIQAADTSDEGANEPSNISVKIKWDDKGQTDKRPDFVTINILKNGQIVDKIILNESNSWKATIEVDNDGSYSVEEDDTTLSNYSISITGNPDIGFTITNAFKSDTLGAAGNDDSDNCATSSDVKDEAPTTENNAADNSADATAENNTSDKNTTDTNSTQNTNQTNITVVQNTTIVKQEPKKEDPVTTTLKNTGLPILLVIVAAIAIIIPITRRK